MTTPTASQKFATKARELIELHGQAAPAHAGETAHRMAREGNVPGCRDWVQIKIAAERLIAAGRQPH